MQEYDPTQYRIDKYALQTEALETFMVYLVFPLLSLSPAGIRLESGLSLLSSRSGNPGSPHATKTKIADTVKKYLVFI